MKFPKSTGQSMKKPGPKPSIVQSNRLWRHIYKALSWRRVLSSTAGMKLLHDQFIAELLQKYQAFRLVLGFGFSNDYRQFSPLEFAMVLPLWFLLQPGDKRPLRDSRFFKVYEITRQLINNQLYLRYDPQQVKKISNYTLSGEPAIVKQQVMRLVQQNTQRLFASPSATKPGLNRLVSVTMVKQLGHEMLALTHQLQQQERRWPQDAERDAKTPAKNDRSIAFTAPDLRHAFSADVFSHQMSSAPQSIRYSQANAEALRNDVPSLQQSMEAEPSAMSHVRQSPAMTMQNSAWTILSVQKADNFQHKGILSGITRNAITGKLIESSNRTPGFSQIANDFTPMTHFRAPARDSVDSPLLGTSKESHLNNLPISEPAATFKWESHLIADPKQFDLIHRKQAGDENVLREDNARIARRGKKQAQDIDEMQSDATNTVAHDVKAVQTLRPKGLAEPSSMAAFRNVDQIAEEVVKIIEKKLKTERERRGIFL